MEKKAALYILFSLFLITGCKSPSEPVRPQAYFPLAVGNKWYYNSDSHDSTLISSIQEITGRKVIDKKIYYVLVSTSLPSGIIDTAFYRLSGDVLFVRSAKDSEHVFADFSLNMNDPVYWQQDIKVPDFKVTEKNDEFMSFGTPWGADYGFTITFKKGVGLILTASNGFVYYRTRLVKWEIK